MSLLPAYEPADRSLARWIRAVRRALTAREEGLRWSENIGPLITLRYNNSNVPYDIDAGTTSRPLAVLCLAATKRDDRSATESGARLVWAWRDGKIRISWIDLTAATTEYDVTLGILQG